MVKTVKAASAILNFMASRNTEMGVTEIARATGMGKSSVHRILRTLVQAGFVRINPATSRYALGLRMVDMARAALTQMDLPSRVRSLLNRLSEELNETVFLSVLDGTRAKILDSVSQSRFLSITVSEDTLYPLHCTSSGKALAAYAGEDFWEVLINEGLTPVTPNTVVEPDVFRRQMREITRLGYACNYGEYEVGTICISVPVPTSEGSVVASLTVAIPSARFVKGSEEEIARKLASTANDLTKRVFAVGSDGNGRLDEPSQDQALHRSIQSN